MNPERWAQIEELFHLAAECDPRQRASLLDGACDGDAELLGAVQVLLVSEESARNDIWAAVDGGLEALTFPLVGETVSHYRILDGLGGGGMGLVYRAEDIKLGRQVALKFLPEGSSKDPAALARFEREARSASALEHPNICPIYEFGEHEGQPFLVMQLLEGQTLRELLSGAGWGTHRVPLDKLLDLAIEMASGLEAAHGRGIIHRDIKPANVFVTTQGQAKILDFGLAKLARSDATEDETGRINDDGPDGKAARLNSSLQATPDPLLSRTGTAMGTAGYMSPEQARGEKLDARTDVFSFGLVLYELATGQRAFEGDTGPALHDAILRCAPSPVRQLNPKLPSKLETIIRKALEKDRAKRYQSAAELRGDLQALKRAVETKDSLRWWTTASLASIGLLVVGGLIWFTRTRTSMSSSLPQITFRQLTINSPENPVTSQAISPNGKFLAYVDRRGMHVRDIETGAVQAVSEPEDLKQESVNWEVIDVGWFPDNARFLANAHPASEDASVWSSRTASIWVLSRVESPRKLRDNAVGWSVSPDGSLVSFGAHAGKLGERETWLMRSDGSDARMFFDTAESSATSGFLWARDGQHGLYFTTNSSGDTLLSRDIIGGSAVALLTPAAFPKSIRGEPVWLPDGRFIYQMSESSSGTNPDEDTCNFWEMRIDQHTGKALQKPRRLTTWTGFCISYANATADGKRIAFLRGATQWAVYVADVEGGGTHIANMRRLTLDESWNLTQDWTNDSKSVVFTSNRTGQFAIYKQSLENDQPELISTGIGSFRDTPVSPDGKWLFAIPVPKAPDPKDSNGLMRVPLTGGAPEMVISTLADEIFCARPPSSLCVLGERTEDRKQLIFTSIDPVKGRGRELARFSLDPAIEYNDFDVSPDGTRLAVSGSTEGPIHILSLRGEAEGVIPVKFNDAQEFHWTADGKGLYVPDQTKRGTVLLYVDLHGKTHSLWEQRGGGWVWARPSPDSRHLAIENSTTSNNVWMMENF